MRDDTKVLPLPQLPSDNSTSTPQPLTSTSILAAIKPQQSIQPTSTLNTHVRAYIRHGRTIGRAALQTS